jgi:hypothetical protein
MDSDLDTLATALYARIDDTLKARPELQPWRPKIVIAPKLSDAELLMALIEIPQVCLPSTTRLLTIGDEMHRYTRERWYTARAGAAAHGDAHGLNANGHINRRLVPRSEEPPTRDRGDTEVGHNHHRSADTHDVTASCCPNWRVTSSRDSCRASSAPSRRCTATRRRQSRRRQPRSRPKQLPAQGWGYTTRSSSSGVLCARPPLADREQDSGQRRHVCSGVVTLVTRRPAESLVWPRRGRLPGIAFVGVAGATLIADSQRRRGVTCLKPWWRTAAGIRRRRSRRVPSVRRGFVARRRQRVGLRSDWWRCRVRRATRPATLRRRPCRSTSMRPATRASCRSRTSWDRPPRSR